MAVALAVQCVCCSRPTSHKCICSTQICMFASLCLFTVVVVIVDYVGRPCSTCKFIIELRKFMSANDTRHNQTYLLFTNKDERWANGRTVCHYMVRWRASVPSTVAQQNIQFVLNDVRSAHNKITNSSRRGKSTLVVVMVVLVFRNGDSLCDFQVTYPSATHNTTHIVHS